jgi:hypothetical protein
MHENRLLPRHTQISTKDVVVKDSFVVTEVRIGELGIPDPMFACIQIRYWPCTRLLRPIAALVLAQKVVVIRLVYHQRNLGRASWAALFKLSENHIRIITSYAGQKIWTGLGFIRSEWRIFTGRTRLVKGRITLLLSATLRHLFRIIYIHGV